ncbi:MAG: carbohydrate ABC transporter permease [Marvinbryantia sp.]|uniref:ABC transporter, permease protein n=1 Tax=Marvinbryantia formatexigens DSM 14469 TaxID=478749 RepID=C6LBC7_9FIRM|nr:sugar ABC transporter permease [Marvinbryantia formatexigens]EET62258.1 ABC transporter, permease protein [Marvinbryantia formatexigens DSM 14469]UWO26421.1 sugar ABC transporter permease [Marvinbryantia formatexigens DSM 14469]SDF81678.1 carbohydrate ABC transporter membrane protein 1, CUT1 family [Marvinbryantia formatexigens]
MNKTKGNKKGLSLALRQNIVGYSFILPNFIGFFIFTFIPVIFSLLLSFSHWDGFTEMEFAGLDNFIKIFKDRIFVQSIWKTAYFSIFTVLFSMVASLGLALLLNQKIKARGFFRCALFFPYVASVVAISVVWNAMLQPDYGPVNEFLKFIGIANPPRWFASTDWVIPGLIIVNVWRNMGYFMIIYLAGLQNIDESLYEAAALDGAKGWTLFRKITWPLLSPSTFFVVMMLVINSFKVFDLVWLMTQGGPGTASTMLSQYIYNQAFVSWDYGKSSAAAMILFVIVALLTVFQFKAEKKVVNY